MPKPKRRLPQAESETISNATSASVDDSGASEAEEELVEERELDERPSAEEGGDAREGAAEVVPDADDFRALLHSRAHGGHDPALSESHQREAASHRRGRAEVLRVSRRRASSKRGK